MINKNSTKEEAVEREEAANETLRRYREKILEAVKQNRYALSWVSDKMQMEIAQCWANAIEQETKND